jgi:hypothetical protein
VLVHEPLSCIGPKNEVSFFSLLGAFIIATKIYQTQRVWLFIEIFVNRAYDPSWGRINFNDNLFYKHLMPLASFIINKMPNSNNLIRF